MIAKRLIFATLFLVALATASLRAQFYDQAIGLRAGTSFEVSYKRFLVYQQGTYADAFLLQHGFEVLGGFQIDERKRLQNGYVVEGLYHLALDIGFDTGFSAFLAGGLYTGVYVQQGVKPKWGGGVTGMLGIEYTFDQAPINLSIDWKPFAGYPRSSILSFGFSIRYVFATTWQ